MIRSFSRVVSSRHRKRSTYAAVARRLPIAAQTYLSSPSSRPLSPSSHSWIPLYLFESRQQFRTSLFATSDLHSTNEYSLILEGLNPSQVEAVTQPNKAVIRVIAGPGSGKTRVLTCRVAYLLKQDPHAQVLAVTFTKKAAEEMRQRVERLLVQQQGQEMPSIQHLDSEVIQQDTSGSTPNDLRRITMGTFHSICAKILRFNGDLLQSLPSVEDDMVGRQEASVNLDGSFAILDASDQLRILKECLDETKIDLKNSSVKPLQILTAIGTIKEALALGKDPLNEFDESKKPIPRPLKYARDIYSLYRGKLLSNNALDFDDLILMTREILIMFPELRERLHRRWPHVLIDEFQDTSRIQMDLVKLLTSSSLLVVGDADQAIYSWRGAHAGSLSDFRTEFEDFTEEGVHTVYLKENYRCVLPLCSPNDGQISSQKLFWY